MFLERATLASSKFKWSNETCLQGSAMIVSIYVLLIFDSGEVDIIPLILLDSFITVVITSWGI